MTPTAAPAPEVRVVCARPAPAPGIACVRVARGRWRCVIGAEALGAFAAVPLALEDWVAACGPVGRAGRG